MISRKFRKNPLSDEISDEDIMEYIETKMPQINAVANQKQIAKALMKITKKKTVAQAVELLKTRLFPSLVKEKIDALEQKITKLAVEYAINEARSNYNVDISEEMYAQFPVARSNPRHDRRSNRQNSRYRRNSRDRGLIYLSEQEREVMKEDKFPMKFTGSNRVIKKDIDQLINLVIRAKNENAEYLSPREMAYDKKERVYQSLLEKIKSTYPQYEDIPFDFGEILSYTDTYKIFGSQGRRSAKAMGKPVYMDINLITFRNKSLQKVIKDKQIEVVLNKMLNKLRGYGYDPRDLDIEDIMTNHWVDEDGYIKVSVDFEEDDDGKPIKALFEYTPQGTLLKVSLITPYKY